MGYPVFVDDLRDSLDRVRLVLCFICCVCCGVSYIVMEGGKGTGSCCHLLLGRGCNGCCGGLQLQKLLHGMCVLADARAVWGLGVQQLRHAPLNPSTAYPALPCPTQPYPT